MSSGSRGGSSSGGSGGNAGRGQRFYKQMRRLASSVTASSPNSKSGAKYRNRKKQIDPDFEPTIFEHVHGGFRPAKTKMRVSREGVSTASSDVSHSGGNSTREPGEKAFREVLTPPRPLSNESMEETLSFGSNMGVREVNVSSSESVDEVPQRRKVGLVSANPLGRPTSPPVISLNGFQSCSPKTSFREELSSTKEQRKRGSIELVEEEQNQQLQKDLKTKLDKEADKKKTKKATSKAQTPPTPAGKMEKIVQKKESSSTASVLWFMYSIVKALAVFVWSMYTSKTDDTTTKDTKKIKSKSNEKNATTSKKEKKASPRSERVVGIAKS